MRTFAVDMLEEPLGRQYAAYVSRFHSRLNGWRLASLVGGSFAIAFYSFFVALGYRWGFPVAGLTPSPATKHLVRWLLVPDLLIQAALAFVVGVVAWRLVVVAWELWHLAGDFDFELQLGHPDKSAGLGPLGDICFSVAAVWGVAAIYPTVWLFTLTLGSVRGTGFFSLAHLSFKGEGALNCVEALQDKISQIPALCPHTMAQARAAQIHAAESVLHMLTFYVGGVLILTFVFAILTFYVPLYFIHRGMERQRPQLFPALDRLGKRIGELTRELGTARPKPAGLAEKSAGASSSKANESENNGEAVASELAALREAYDARNAVPEWPFDAKVLGKFVGSTVIPLTGLTTWLPALISKSVGA
jgi:hypothetical protein